MADSTRKITITAVQAEKLFDLYNNVYAADSHYQRCQSDQFRLHVKAVYQNAGVQKAFEDLRAALDKAEKVESTESSQKAAESPRKGVLGK